MGEGGGQIRADNSVAVSHRHHHQDPGSQRSTPYEKRGQSSDNAQNKGDHEFALLRTLNRVVEAGHASSLLRTFIFYNRYKIGGRIAPTAASKPLAERLDTRSPLFLVGSPGEQTLHQAARVFRIRY